MATACWAFMSLLFFEVAARRSKVLTHGDQQGNHLLGDLSTCLSLAEAESKRKVFMFMRKNLPASIECDPPLPQAAYTQQSWLAGPAGTCYVYFDQDTMYDPFEVDAGARVALKGLAEKELATFMRESWQLLEDAFRLIQAEGKVFSFTHASFTFGQRVAGISRFRSSPGGHPCIAPLLQLYSTATVGEYKKAIEQLSEAGSIPTPINPKLWVLKSGAMSSVENENALSLESHAAAGSQGHAAYIKTQVDQIAHKRQWSSSREFVQYMSRFMPETKGDAEAEASKNGIIETLSRAFQGGGEATVDEDVSKNMLAAAELHP